MRKIADYLVVQAHSDEADMPDAGSARAPKRKASFRLSAAKKRAAEAQGQRRIDDFFKEPTVTPPVGDRTNAAASPTETTRPEPISLPVEEVSGEVASPPMDGLAGESNGTDVPPMDGSTGFTAEDLEIMLSETEWLNDDVLNKCLELARSKSPKGDFIKVFDTGAATAYSRPATDLSFMKSEPMQIFPVCDGTHWIVCVFVNLGEAAPACLVLDSGKRYSRLDVPSTENSPNTMYDLVHGLVANVERAYAKSVPRHILDVPQQPNGHDCGCYVYYFVEQMMEWYGRVVAGDYLELAWDFEIPARNHMRQACLNKEAISQTTSAPASTEVENEAPVLSPVLSPELATSDNEKSPPGPSHPKSALDIVNHFIDILKVHNAAVLEIYREKRLDESSKVFNPLIEDVKRIYRHVTAGLYCGRAEAPFRTNFKNLARSIASLSSALCTSDAENHGKMEEYRRFVEDSAVEISQIGAAAYKQRRALGSPQRKRGRMARLPEDSGKGECGKGSENETSGPVTSPEPAPEPVLATSDNDEKSPSDPSHSKSALETLHDFLDILEAHNFAVLEIHREKRLDVSSNEAFYPLIEEVKHEYTQVKRGLYCGRAEKSLRTNFKKLARSITSLSSALCTSDAENHGRMEEYRRFVEDSADEISQIGAAAFKQRIAPGAPQRKPRRMARLPEDSGMGDRGEGNESDEQGHTGTDEHKLQKFDIPSIQTPVVGIGADEEVWLFSGGFKKMRDLEEGDLVMNRTGKPVKVLKAATVVEADSFEITRDSTAVDSNLVTRQRVTVGALQRLEVTLHQIPKRMDYQEPTRQDPYVRCEFYELVSTVWSEEQVVDKPRKQSAAVSYSASDGTPASTKEEARQMLEAKLSALNIQEIVRYYAKTCDLVRFNEPEDVSLRYYFAAATIEPFARAAAKATFGIIQTPVPAELNPEYEEVAKMLQRFSPDVQANALYLMGLWVGDGTMKHPEIAVDSLDIESMRLCAEYASQLGVDCDILYEHTDKCDFTQFSGYREGVKSLWIRLSDPTGLLSEGEAELEAFHRIIMEKDEKAKEWREQQQGGKNPYDRKAAYVVFYDGWTDIGQRNRKCCNLVWDLFLLTRAKRPHGEWVKSVPMWLTISPVEWREAFLAGLVESDGYREKKGSYRIATIYPEVRDGLVSLARSLGIPSNAYIRTRGGWNMDIYIVSFDKCDALHRAMLRVASPRKLPDGTPPGPEWVAEPPEDNFTCTLQGAAEIASGVEVEGHEFLMKSFFVMLDSKAELNPQKVVEYLIDRKCIVDECDDNIRGPSWDNRLGKLCGKHYARYKEAHVYCTACNYVPTKTEARLSRHCKKCRQPTLKKAKPDREHVARSV